VGGGPGVTTDWMEEIFDVGRVDTGGVKGSIGPRPCGPPNTTVDNTDDEDTQEEGVTTLVLDDPSTSLPADHWLHPCDCFPEFWGTDKPVSDESVEDVPPGSANQFTPPEVMLVLGSSHVKINT